MKHLIERLENDILELRMKPLAKAEWYIKTVRGSLDDLDGALRARNGAKSWQAARSAGKWMASLEEHVGGIARHGFDEDNQP